MSLFLCGHIINGRCAGSRPVSRFDSGCSASPLEIIPTYYRKRVDKYGQLYKLDRRQEAAKKEDY